MDTMNDYTADADNETLRILDRMNVFMLERDLSVVEEFAPDADVLLVASEANELAIGSAEIKAFFGRLMSHPVTYSWDWRQKKVSSAGDIAWIFADGDIVMHGAEGEVRTPYRMTAVLERYSEKWLIRQFHGSEPAHRP
jgi:hypothetical protein